MKHLYHVKGWAFINGDEEETLNFEVQSEDFSGFIENLINLGIQFASITDDKCVDYVYVRGGISIDEISKIDEISN